MSKILQQGQADGLCGLYAVLNFLNRTEWKDTPSNGLWYLLDACRHFGWLTPQHLIEGFEDYHLKAILDLQFQVYRMPYVTHFLSDVARAQSSLQAKEIYNRVTGKGGSVLAQTGHGGHWVLLTQSSIGTVVFDSADGGKGPTPLSRRRISTNLDWGVVILPCQLPIAEIEI